MIGAGQSSLIPPDSILKSLQDKSLEKRKQAASELQKEVELLIDEKKTNEIDAKIRSFDLCTQELEVVMRRRAGLYGLSVITVALYQRRSKFYLKQLINPVLKCFRDKEPKVVQAACDALFNILKIIKEGILEESEKFLEIYSDVLNMISQYQGQLELQDWGKSVDDLLKNLVYTALSKGYPFDLKGLIKLIYQRLNTTPQADVIIVLLKWIELLHSIQNVNILPSVPKFLQKLLINIDYKVATNTKCEVPSKSYDLLQMFLREFERPMSRSVKLDNKIINELLRFLLEFKQSNITAMGNDKVHSLTIIQIDKSKSQALDWLLAFMGFFLEDYQAWQRQEDMFIMDLQKKRQAQGPDSQLVVPESQSRKFIGTIFQLQFPDIIRVVLTYASTQDQIHDEKVNAINDKLLDFVKKTVQNSKSDFEKIFQELKSQFKDARTAKTKQIIIKWFNNLFNTFQEELIDRQTDVFEQLINSLDFGDSNLVKSVLDLLCKLAEKNEKYLKKIIRKLIERFQKNAADMNQDKINQVLQVLCNSINAERVFLEFAKILGQSTRLTYDNKESILLVLEEEKSQFSSEKHHQDHLLSTDIDFAQHLVGTLTISLCANPHYEQLRAKLRGKEPTEVVESKEVLFETLFNTWCVSPVSTLTLCLLSRNFELAYNLIPRFTMVEIDTLRLIQLGNLVQLLESPSFTNLRIELMRQDRQTQYLLKTLQGILMILPISKAFQALKTRIDCIANHQNAGIELPLAVYNQKNAQTIFFFGEDYLMKEKAEEAKKASVNGKKVLSLEECLNCFDERLLQCQEYSRNKVRQELESRENSKRMTKQMDTVTAGRQRSQIVYAQPPKKATYPDSQLAQSVPQQSQLTGHMN